MVAHANEVILEKKNNNKTSIDVSSEDFWKARDGLKEHVLSLAKLAEKTVAEANNMAIEVKKKALAQAEVEANAILAKAEEQAQHMIEEKRLEARAIANKEAEVIKANAQQVVKRLCTELTSQLETQAKVLAPPGQIRGSPSALCSVD